MGFEFRERERKAREIAAKPKFRGVKGRPPPHLTPHLIFQDPSERLNRVVGHELEEQRRPSTVEEDFYGAAILFRFRRLLERRRGTRKKKQLLVGGGGGGGGG